AATTATTGANTATAKAAEAVISAGTASTAATTATARLADMEALYDQFDDRYLGAKAADPALDNDGNPLVSGAFYINTVSGYLRAYTIGGGWVQGIASVAGVTSIDGQTGAITLKTVNGQSVRGAGNIAIATGLTLVPVATTAQVAAVGNNYALNNVAATNMTGPAAATAGDKWAITVCNGLTINTVNWNGLKHEGISDASMTLSSATRFDFEYISAGFGWKVNQ
ncbi:MAG: hypothetical protein ABI606_09450, partial [Rhodoferax sp.]